MSRSCVSIATETQPLWTKLQPLMKAVWREELSWISAGSLLHRYHNSVDDHLRMLRGVSRFCRSSCR